MTGPGFDIYLLGGAAAGLVSGLIVAGVLHRVFAEKARALRDTGERLAARAMERRARLLGLAVIIADVAAFALWAELALKPALEGR